MLLKSSFKPAWWLTNAHAQTIYPTLMRRDKSPVDVLERFELPDGDFIDLAWAVNGLDKDAPLVICLHGLGGNMNSPYAIGLMHAFNRQGWRSVLMHFRGASNEPNRLPRAYHSGDTADIDFLLRLLNQREPHTKKTVVGVSLGGNVLLKWLGEQQAEAQTLIQGAVAISVPFELRLIADRMGQGFSRIYQSHLLQRLREVFVRKFEHHQNQMPFSIEQLDDINCFWTFDDQITAPLHGYTNVHTYYREASSRQYIPKIATPTLIIHALDDPFMTPAAIPSPEELPPEVTLELSQKGGHVGFISGNLPGRPFYWLEERVPAFLVNLLNTYSSA